MKRIPFASILLLLTSLTFTLHAEDAPKPAEQSGVVEEYLNVQTALAADDFDAAKQAASNLQEKAAAGEQEAVAVAAGKVAASDSIDEARTAFSALSQSTIAYAKTADLDEDTTVHVVHCPMALKNEGADWLQASKDIANPYFGAKMLNCGSVKETLGEE